MAFFRKIFGIKDARVNHDFDDEDRQQSLVLKSYQREIKRIQREIEVFTLKRQLEELKSTMTDANKEEGDEFNVDAIMDRLLKLAEMQKQPLKEMSDEEIDKILKATPKEMLKKAKTMSNEDLKKILNKQYPGYSEMSIDRAIKRIKA